MKLTATIRKYLRPPLVLGIAAFVFALLLQEDGHSWGDDFALYVNQARSLVDGDVARVLVDNSFMRDNSPWPYFTAPVYPWGLPIMLAPAIALFGLNWMALKVVVIACLGAFVAVLQVLMEKRLGRINSIAICCLVILSPLYWTWAGTVASDIPSLLFFFGSLVWMDKIRDAGLESGFRWRHSIIMGLLMAWSFSIRRETLVLALALLVLQASLLLQFWKTSKQDRLPLSLLKTLARPYYVALGAVALLQVWLPATLFPERPSGGGWNALWPNFVWYRYVVAEALGIKALGDHPIQFMGSSFLGSLLLAIFVLLVVIGMLSSLIRFQSRDVHLAVALVGTGFAVGIQPFTEYRYVMSVLPLMLYFAVQLFIPRGDVSEAGIASYESDSESVRKPKSASIGGLVAFVLLLAPSFANWDDAVHAFNNHRRKSFVIEGPETPEAQEMFSAVIRCTRGQDVISFAQARTMNLYTKRRAIQGSSIEWVLGRADWVVVTNDDVNYYEPPFNEISAPNYGLTRVWFNDVFSLYKVPTSSSLRYALCAPR